MNKKNSDGGDWSWLLVVLAILVISYAEEKDEVRDVSGVAWSSVQVMCEQCDEDCWVEPVETCDGSGPSARITVEECDFPEGWTQPNNDEFLCPNCVGRSDE